MQLSYSPLTALSPLEGRYFSKSAELREFFSEYALIKYRYQVELSWFLSLAQNPQIKELAISSTAEDYLNELINNFDENTAQKIKDLEKITNHDVKAVEYQIRSDFEKNAELKNYLSFIHFSCTSEDINNLAYALMLNEGRDFLLNSFDDVKGRFGSSVKNATERRRRNLNKLCKSLLRHVLTFHDFFDSIFHAFFCLVDFLPQKGDFSKILQR